MIFDNNGRFVILETGGRSVILDPSGRSVILDTSRFVISRSRLQEKQANCICV